MEDKKVGAEGGDRDIKTPVGFVPHPLLEGVDKVAMPCPVCGEDHNWQIEHGSVLSRLCGSCVRSQEGYFGYGNWITGKRLECILPCSNGRSAGAICEDFQKLRGGERVR